MRTVNTELVTEYAERLRPLLPEASKAYGARKPDSVPRRASDEVNKLILEYVEKHNGNMTHLARALEGHISLPGLRRRLRSARGGSLTKDIGYSRKRGSKDPEKVSAAAHKIRQARNVSPAAYAEAVRQAYRDNISLSAIAKELGINYYSLWAAASHN